MIDTTLHTLQLRCQGCPGDGVDVAHEGVESLHVVHHHQPLQLLALGPGGQPPQVPHRDPGLGVGGGFGITYHSNCFDVYIVHLIYYTFFNFSAHSLVFIVVEGVEGDAVLQAVDLGPPGAGHQQLPEHGRQVEPLVRAVVRLQ